MRFWAAPPILLLAAGSPALTGEPGDPPVPDPISTRSLAQQPPLNLWTGENVALGGVLYPHFHFLAAFGTSSAEDIAETIAAGHHDPNRDGFTFQNIETGASLRVGDYVSAFAVYAAVIDLDDEWSGSWEEIFGKLDQLPGGFELRAGRYFNRLAFSNAVHPHGYFFVDKNLVEARMFGEDGVTTEGAEITWRLPTPFTSLLSYSYGEIFVEEEGHAHGDEEHEALFEGDGAAFGENVQTLHSITQWNYNDFHQFTGHLSAAWGDNLFDRNTSIFAAGIEYLWRENGFEPGGKHLRFRTGAAFRDVQARSGELAGEGHEDHDDDHGDEPGQHDARTHDLPEWGVTTSVEYGFADRWEMGFGAAWVEGIAVAGVPERLRLSPILIWKPWTNTRIKLQYNYDHLAGSGRGDEHSIWLGLVHNWGGAEVR